MKYHKYQIVEGMKFAYWTVIRELPKEKGCRQLSVRCQCGVEKTVKLYDLVNGKTKSCGCMRFRKHSMSHTPLYKVWNAMRQRCYNPKCSNYKKYGAKGIRMCDEWYSDFANFFNWAMSNGYRYEKMPNGKNKYTIDRIDSEQGYSPENCRWATEIEQNTHLVKLSTNTSGYTGVSWSKLQRKWICNISINNKTVRIGAYETQKEAVEARNQYITQHNLLHQKLVYIGELHRQNNNRMDLR